MFYCALLYVHSSFAIILMGKERWLLYFVCLPGAWCLMFVVWLFLTMPQVCLQIVIVVFPDYTHYFGIRASPASLPCVLEQDHNSLFSTGSNRLTNPNIS